MEIGTISTYEEACALIQEWGLLPLSGDIPEHPSIGSVTLPGAWHTGSDADPWLWRTRFSNEGIAAYGRMIGDQTLLVDRELFPVLHAALRSEQSREERVEAGLLSEHALRLFLLIADNPGIDVRLLRKLADMSEKTLKKSFDCALIELQHTADIVISGVQERRSEQDNKNGWNSTCFMTAAYWMNRRGLTPCLLPPVQAIEMLFSQYEDKWQEEAITFLRKKINKQREKYGG